MQGGCFSRKKDKIFGYFTRYIDTFDKAVYSVYVEILLNFCFSYG